MMKGISKRKKISVYICFVSFINSPVLAYGGPFWMIYTGRPIISLGVGANITSDLGEPQSFPHRAPIIDTQFHYAPERNTQVEPIFDVFLGEEWILSPKWALALGALYNQTTPFEVNGVFQQGILPLLSRINFDYRYYIRVSQILVENKLSYLCFGRYRPYFFLGLGAAINYAHHYRSFFPIPELTRQFKTNTNTNFSYSVGLGIDVDMLNNLRLGIGYRFSDFGEAKLGHSTIFHHSVSSTLSQSHLYTNMVLTQLTFLFC